MRSAAWRALGAVLLCCIGASLARALPAEPPAQAVQVVRIGSKRFTESYILGELLRQQAETTDGAQIVYKPGLGNTGIVVAALESGAIDVYPEYTGTVDREILKRTGASSLDEMNRQLASIGLAAGVPLGFDNNYALAMRESQAEALKVRTVSDLAAHPDLRIGLSQEFIGREDGWQGLKAAYSLPFATPRGLDHGLAFDALAAQRVDVIDIYSTDAKIDKLRLRVLVDDRHYFPSYAAILLYRADLPRRAPAVWAALSRLRGRISAPAMRAMNAQAELQHRPFTQIAKDFLSGGGQRTAGRNSAPAPFLSLLFGADFWRLAWTHVTLVFVSLAFSVLAGLPLGVWAYRSPRMAQQILAAVNIVQTIPSLALLAFLIPLLHAIGTLPTLVALFLYGLLPIVRNTYAGLRGIAPGLRDAAAVLGLTPGARLRWVELPLAAPTIMAGIKTSAVINVGTATIAAFVGAGGFGERIATGLALNDSAMLLAGAIPSAALALLVQAGFEIAERFLVPAGLRHEASQRTGGRR